MRRSLLIIGMLLCVAFPCHAQNQVLVTATVTSPDGKIYSGATGAAVLVTPGNAQPMYGSQTVSRNPQPISGVNGFGTFSIQLWNTTLLSPTPVLYRFNITDASGHCSFQTGTIAIIGPVDLSTFISSYAAPLAPCQGGGGGGGINVHTTNYTAVSGDQGKLISFNCSSACTLTLPSPPPSSTWFIDVENIGAGTLTVSRNGLTIDAVASNLSLTTDLGVRVFTNGSNYFTERGMGTSGGGPAAHVQSGGTLPGTCSPSTGDIYFLTAAGPIGGIYTCTATNIWTAGAGLTGLNSRGVTGTTATDTVLFSDNDTILEFDGSVSVAESLPTPTTLGNAFFWTVLHNATTGSATTVTVTPAGGWTVDGSATLSIRQGQTCRFSVDPSVGTNWIGACGNQSIVAGANITLTPSAYGLSIAAPGGGSGGWYVAGQSIQWLSELGSDSNDGLSPATAKLTWDGACAALYGGSNSAPLTCGKGDIYVIGSPAANTDATKGRWLLGPSEVNYV